MTATLPTDPAAATPLPRRRPAWVAVGLVVAFVMIAFGAWSIGSALSRQPIQFQRSWAGPVRTVDLDISNGSVTLVGGGPTGAVVQAHGARGVTSPTDYESLRQGTLRIRSSCFFALASNWCSLSYRVQVPAAATVVAHTGDGRVTASGLSGHLDLSSGNGGVTVERPSGNLTLHSGDGRVQVTGATSARVTASSGDGAVHLGFTRPPYTVAVHSGDGSVTVGLPHSTVAYRVTAHSGDGHVSSPVRTDPTSSRTITVTSGDGSVTIRYGSG